MNLIEHRCSFCLLPAPVGQEFCKQSCADLSREWDDDQIIYATDDAKTNPYIRLARE